MTTTDNYFSFILSTLLTRAFNLVSTSGIRLDSIVARRFTVDLIIFLHLGRLLINDSINKKNERTTVFRTHQANMPNICFFMSMWNKYLFILDFMAKKKKGVPLFFYIKWYFQNSTICKSVEKLELAPSGCCQVAVPELCRQIMLTF